MGQYNRNRIAAILTFQLLIVILVLFDRATDNQQAEHQLVVLSSFSRRDKQ